jgi:hypothetical protein
MDANRTCTATFRLPETRVQWAKTYGGPDYDKAESIQQTSDGGYIVAGRILPFSTSADILVLKLDQNGNIQWQKAFGEANRHGFVGVSIQQTSDGGFVVGTTAYSAGESGDNIWVLKLDQNGKIQWEKTYGAGSSAAHSIQQTSDGGYIIVAGWTYSAGTNHDILVLKLDQNGNIQWQKTYGGPSWDGAYSIRQTSDGGYVVAGETFSFGAGGDIWVLKLDANGDIGGCSLIGTSNATVSDTTVNGVTTSVSPKDTSVSAQDSTAIIRETTVSSSQQCGAP